MNNNNFDKIFSYNFSSIGNYAIYFDLDISSLISLKYMFGEVRKIISIKFSPTFNMKNIKNMDRMFYYCIYLNKLDLSIFNTLSITSMNRMFYSCRILISLDVSSFNTSSITNMNGLFDSCTYLTSIDASKFDTSIVALIGYMLNNMALLSLDVSNFDTSNVR